MSGVEMHPEETRELNMSQEIDRNLCEKDKSKAKTAKENDLKDKIHVHCIYFIFA